MPLLSPGTNPMRGFGSVWCPAISGCSTTTITSTSQCKRIGSNHDRRIRAEWIPMLVESTVACSPACVGCWQCFQFVWSRRVPGLQSRPHRSPRAARTKNVNFLGIHALFIDDEKRDRRFPFGGILPWSIYKIFSGQEKGGVLVLGYRS